MLFKVGCSIANYASGFTGGCYELFQVNWHHIFVGKPMDFPSVIVDASVLNNFSQENCDEHIGRRLVFIVMAV